MTKLWRKPFDAAEKAVVPGRVTIDKERCKGCGYCTEFCPRDVLKMSEEIGPKGYNFAVVVDPDKCVSCGLCEIICPEFATHLNSAKPDKD